VINLVNPLSVATAILAASGVRCLGVCELPLVTAQHAARVLGVPFASLGWAYDGLNHRGFIHDLTIEGHDQLPDSWSGWAERRSTASRATSSKSSTPCR